jgi:8-oxo-dGTP diphosphatase
MILKKFTDAEIIEYENKLPKKRMAVGVLFFNVSQELLILKPVYKEGWIVPGGVVEENESMRDAAIREVKEEINLDASSLALLAIDYLSPATSNYKNKSENIQFIFDGGTLSREQIKSMRLAEDEIGEFKFIKNSELSSYLRKNLLKRLPACLEAKRSKAVLYLENGEKI